MRLGPTEIVLILAVVVLLFGGKKIAGMGKSLGKSIREFKEEVHSDGEVPAESAVQSAAPVQAEAVTAETKTTGEMTHARQ